MKKKNFTRASLEYIECPVSVKALCRCVEVMGIFLPFFFPLPLLKKTKCIICMARRVRVNIVQILC